MKTKIIRDEELNRLADACCRAFEVNIEDFFSRCKRANIADARKAYYHIIKSFYEMNEYQISFNVPLMRHRTTIMFAVDAASDLLEFDEPFRVRYGQAYKLFTGSDRPHDKLTRRLILHKNR